MGGNACSCFDRREDGADPERTPCRPEPHDVQLAHSSSAHDCRAPGCRVEASLVVSGRCLRYALGRRCAPVTAHSNFAGATPRLDASVPSGTTSIWRVDVTSLAAGRPLGFLKPPETVPEEAFGKSPRGRFLGHNMPLGGPGRRPRTQLELDCLDAVRAFRVRVLCVSRLAADGRSQVHWSPGDGVRLKLGDTLHVAGSDEAVKRFAAGVGECSDIKEEMQWNVVPVPPRWVGWRIGRRTDSFPLGLNLRLTCGAEPLALRQADGSVHMFPDPESELADGQELLFMRSLSSQPETCFEFEFQAQLLDLDSWRFFSGAGSTAVLGAHDEAHGQRDVPRKTSEDMQRSPHCQNGYLSTAEVSDKIATEEELSKIKIKLGIEDNHVDPGPLEQPEFEPPPPGDSSRCSGNPLLAAMGSDKQNISSRPSLNLKIRSSKTQRTGVSSRIAPLGALEPSSLQGDTACMTARTDGGMTRSTATPRDERCLSARTDGSYSARGYGGAMTWTDQRLLTARTEGSLSARGRQIAWSDQQFLSAGTDGDQQCMSARTDGNLTARGRPFLIRSQYYGTWEANSASAQDQPLQGSSRPSEAW